MPGRKIAAIALKDLRSTVRNVSALVMMIAAPLALASLLGFAFGGSESFDIAAIKVALANLDEGITASSVGAEGTGAAGGGSGDTSTGGAGPAENANAGDALQGVLTSSQLADVLAVTPMRSAVAARRAVDDGSAAVGVIVPADLSRVIAGSMQAATSRVELYENPTADIGGSIVEGVVGGVLADLNGARAAAVAAVALRSDGAGDPPAAEVAAAAAKGYVRGGGVTSALRIEQRSPTVGAAEREISITGGVLAGMMVFFMFFGAANVAQTILTEHREGTLPRLFTTPTSHGVVLAGKFVGVVVTVLLQAVVLLIAGRLIFAIDWGALDAVALLTLVAAAVAGGLALMIISLARTPAQAGAIGSGVYLVIALLGGNFTGGAEGSGAFAVVQKLTPNGWLLQGWNLAMRGAGAADIVAQVVVPVGFAALFFIVAVLRMRRRFA